ncbi:hypothetical protein ABZR86_16605 [Dyella marensis]|uniref:YD repeat-containing protein n=1 Tax=Dyella marensis TaxID=500610 RepID=A0A1I2H6P5_9GAMM|nr:MULTISPECIES: hypothetical protein [Dyella]SFF25864.1 YD repeat-containing protein [Dyella marensis]
MKLGSRRWVGQWVFVWIALLVASHAWSQAANVTPENEYKKRIRVSEDIQPLGENPFGEQIGLYNGALSFEEKDVSTSGTGPSIDIVRSFGIPNVGVNAAFHDYHANAFVDWALEIPHIETLSAPTKNVVNGVTSYTWFDIDDFYGTQRCSELAAGPTMYVSVPGSVVTYNPEDWWHGYQLVIPGGGKQDLLWRDASNTLAPQMTAPGGGAMSFPIVTRQHWSIGCLAQTANGQPGEGYLAVAPDGTRYWMDWLIYKSTDMVLGQPGGALKRRTLMLMVSKVQDRFGNTVNYSYDSNGNLTSIQADDGRQVTLNYVQWQAPASDPGPASPATTYTSFRISSITLQPSSGAPRTWNYSYSSDPTIPRLTGVQLPDGSSWSFNMGGLPAAEPDMVIDYGGADTCSYTLYPNSGLSGSATLTHPSGLVGTFSIKTIVRGRSYVPEVCNGTTPGRRPRVYAESAIQQKMFSGAGMANQTWNYSYSAPNESWNKDCSAGCTSTVTTDVVDPSGNGTRYTFSNRYDATESLLQQTDYYTGAVGGTLLRSAVTAYANPTGGPWPAMLGSSTQVVVNDAQLGELIPVSQQTLQQDGDTYVWLAEAFNAYTQVTKTKRYNSIAGQAAIEEQTSYLNDLPHWVLGLPQETDNLTTGETESINTYDLSNVTLQSRSRFGQTLMTYAFDGQGQLASFTDPNSHTTTLSNYKRGIPQTIGYPDNTSQSLAVDDFGQISSITDQAGSTTSYSYDSIGRITGITYPTGDEVAWYPKSFSYAYVTGAERGIGGGHWRRITTKGNAVTTTYFDVMLHPILSDASISGTANSDISTRTDYDWKGQKTFASYPVSGAPDLGSIGSGVSSVYDALGRLTQTQQPSELGTLTTATAYLSGARKQVTDPKGYVTTTSYQVFDQPGYDAVIQVQAPEGISQAVARDLYGNPLTITQSGNYGTESDNVSKTLTYDNYHRLCRTTEPESGSEVTAYDAANNVAWTASGMSITGTGCGQEQVPAATQAGRTYDAMNRVLTLVPPSGTQSTTYAYDALGNVATATSGLTYWTAYRNKLGQLTGESLQVSGQSQWRMGYAHDAYGSVSTIQYPNGEAVGYAPDALGRATQVGSYATGVAYYPDGDLASFTYGSGDSYAAQKNVRQLLSNFTYGNGGTLKLSEDYAYDKNGNISTITDLTSGTRTKSFGYDTLNRLTQAQANNLWGTETYSYDPLNNIRSRVSGGQAFTYNYDATNRLASITQGASNVVTLGYDSRGNVNNRNGTTLNFDQKNQLTSAQGYDSYAYDASGRRVMKAPSSGAGATYYFYTQAGQLVYAFDASASKATNYIYLGKKLIARNESLQLSAPASISFSANPNNGNYTVSWTAVAGATGYNLNESTDGGVTWAQAGGGTLTTNSLALINKSGGSYTYEVQACASAGCTTWTVSSALGVTPVQPVITVPTGTTNGNYSVSWSATVSATSYDVQEAVNNGAWTTIASGTTATSISRPGTSSGSYTYQVQASNAYGTRGWATSSAVTVDTTYGVVPPAPASVTVPAASADGTATVSWASVAQVTHYTLQQSSDGGTNWTQVYDGAALSAPLSGLANGSYTYRVEACNAYNCSPWQAGGNALVVTHPPTGAPTLTAPANSTNGSFTISWTAVSTATSYTLQESVDGGSTWAQVQANGNTSWPTSGRSNGNYNYRVQACNVGGCAGWSSTGTTTVLLPPPTPTGITVPATSNGPIPVSWNASPTATRYDLYQNINNAGWTLVASVSATSVTVTATTSGGYQFFVAAYNASGWNGAVNNSSLVTVTIPPGSAPTLSVPASNSSGSYTVSWSAVSGATSYNLEEQLNGGGWTLVQANSSTSWGASGRGNGTYGYMAQACNAGGCGPWSGVSNVSVALIPAVPTGLHTVTVNSTKGSYTVAWTAVSGATSYNMQQTLPDSTVTMPYTGTATQASATDIGVNGTVTVQVRACNASGCSAWSGGLSIAIDSN